MSVLRSSVVVFAAASVTFAAGAFAQSGPPAGTNFVYLNSQKIVQQAPGSSEAQRTFQRELTEYNSDVQALAQVVDSLRKDYQRQEVLLSPQAKEQKQKDLLAKQQELQKHAKELEDKASKRQRELLQPILDRVSATIEQLRQERGYAMIFDISNQGVVAADPSLDITDLILNRLKAAAPAPTDSTAASKP